MKFTCKYNFLGFLFPLLTIFTNTAFAKVSNVGEVAETLISGTDVLTQIMLAVAFILGLGFMLFALGLYRTHRINPKFVPLDRPVLYFILGIVLCCIPFLGDIFGGTYNSMDHKRRQSAIYSTQDIDAPLDVSANN